MQACNYLGNINAQIQKHSNTNVSVMATHFNYQETECEPGESTTSTTGAIRAQFLNLHTKSFPAPPAPRFPRPAPRHGDNFSGMGGSRGGVCIVQGLSEPTPGRARGAGVGGGLPVPGPSPAAPEPRAGPGGARGRRQRRGRSADRGSPR